MLVIVLLASEDGGSFFDLIRLCLGVVNTALFAWLPAMIELHGISEYKSTEDMGMLEFHFGSGDADYIEIPSVKGDGEKHFRFFGELTAIFGILIEACRTM